MYQFPIGPIEHRIVECACGCGMKMLTKHWNAKVYNRDCCAPNGDVEYIRQALPSLDKGGLACNKYYYNIVPSQSFKIER